MVILQVPGVGVYGNMMFLVWPLLLIHIPHGLRGGLTHQRQQELYLV